jgi:hypothetical protein
VRGLGGGNDPLRAGKPERRFKRRVLFEGAGLDESLVDEAAEEWSVAVIPQAASVHRRRNEVMAERVHRHERRHSHRVAEVVAIDAARQRRTGRGLAGDEAGGLAVAQVCAQERIGDAGEVGAAADAADHGVRILAGHLHLDHRLLADHRLVEEDVIQHRAKRVVRLLVASRDLDRLRDRDSKRSGVVLGLGAARLGLGGWAAVNRCAPGLHHRAAVGLLVVARADHEDEAVHVHQPAGEG